jgi:hypothetical protein
LLKEKFNQVNVRNIMRIIIHLLWYWFTEDSNLVYLKLEPNWYCIVLVLTTERGRLSFIKHNCQELTCNRCRMKLHLHCHSVILDNRSNCKFIKKMKEDQRNIYVSICYLFWNLNIMIWLMLFLEYSVLMICVGSLICE